LAKDELSSRLAPPSGFAPPASASVDGVTLDLLTLAQEICRRYRLQYPDEEARYGEAGHAWCVHDIQHQLNWAAGDVNGFFEMKPQVAWLAKVLEARQFPLDRLAVGLDLGAEVLLEQVGGSAGQRLAAVLSDAGSYVRSRDTFLAGDA
jgi:hypothetical protein